MTTATGPTPVRRHTAGIRRGQAAAGYLFTAPAVIVLAVFLVIPIFMALWVSFSDWGGRGSPFSPDVHFVGLKNYAGDHLRRRARRAGLRHVAAQQPLVRDRRGPDRRPCSRCCSRCS